MEGDMNDIASALRWHGANSPAAAAMLAAAHLASQDLPLAYHWEIEADNLGSAQVDIMLGYPATERELTFWAAYLGVAIETELFHGRMRIFVRRQYMNVPIRVWTLIDKDVAIPIDKGQEPAAAAEPAPDPAEALGQQPAAALPPEPYQTRPDGRMAPPAAPPAAPATATDGMYGGIR